MEKIYKLITKNKKNTFTFLIILTLISSIPILLLPGLKQGHDAYFHLGRISALAENIKNFNFFNGIYPFYFNNYGYANGLFYPDLLLYIPATLNALNLNLITSYKIFIVLINFFSILNIFICIKGISKNKYAAILGSIIYAFASYRLVDIYERSALGESLSFVFCPLVIYGIYEILFDDKKKFYYLIIGMSGLIFSHILSTYIIGILLFVICLLNIKKLFKENRYLYLILSAIITFLITSYFLLPMLEQMISQDFYYNNTSTIEEFKLYNRTVPIYLLFLEIPNLGSIISSKYWIPSGIGIIFIYFIYKIIKSKNNDKIIKQSLWISIITLLLITFTPFWKLKIINKLFYMIQFPWRLYLIPTLLLTIFGSIVISKINKSKKFLGIVFIISMISLISMNVISLIPNRLYSISSYDAAFSEYLPVEIDLNHISNRGEIIISNNPVNHSFSKKNTNMKIEFSNNNNSNTYLELPLIYYKGYYASIGDEELDVFKTNNGLVGIKINDIKSGIINISYKGTKIAKITKYISLISSILFIIYVVKEVKYEK